MDVIDHIDSPQTWVRKIVQGTDRLVSINIGDTWLENGHYIYQLWYLAFVFYHRTYTYCLNYCWWWIFFFENYACFLKCMDNTKSQATIPLPYVDKQDPSGLIWVFAAKTDCSVMDDQGHMKSKLWPEGKHPAVPAAKEIHCLRRECLAPLFLFFCFC